MIGIAPPPPFQPQQIMLADLVHPVDSFDFAPHLKNADWMAIEDYEVGVNLELEEILPPHKSAGRDQPNPIQCHSARPEKRDQSINPHVETEEFMGPSPSSGRNRHRNEKRHRKRAAATAKLGHTPRLGDIKQHLQESPIIQSDVDVTSLGARGGGYTATHSNPRNPKREVNLEELLKSGFRLIEWDGV